MELIPNSARVLLRAWSTRLMGLAAALEIAQQIVPYVSDYLPWYVSVGVILASIGARVVKQEGLADVEA